MSRSPQKLVSREAATDYTQAFRALYQMQAAGRSFSGHERHCVFLNTGQTRFANISGTSGLDFMDDGRGVAYVDWDHDGDLDLWINNRTAPQARFLRNDTPSDHHFLAVHLEGRQCNRDAIGARVEVYVRDQESGDKGQGAGVGQTRIKTLYAGHGFLAQSSKWLHFGLARQDKIDHVLVRWPGGATETFTALVADHHYKIIQGRPAAQPWTRPSAPVKLATSRLDGNAPATAGRIFLSVPIPMPKLRYKNFPGHHISLNDGLSGPTLVNLWASWCLPCHAELKDFTEHEAELRKAGLEVIALSVDGLDPNTTNATDAKNRLEEMKFPFESGLAGSETLTKLQLVHDALFSRQIPLAVPMSFLINGDGQLEAIYRGQVEASRLLEDMERLDRSKHRRHALASPFPGRWAFSSKPSLRKIADLFEEKGMLDDAIGYLCEGIDRRPEDVSLYTKLATLHKRQGDLPAALKFAHEALRLDPTSAVSHYNVALLLDTQGTHKDAIDHYRRAIQIRPEYVVAHYKLAYLLRKQGQFGEAIQHAQRVLDIDPDFEEGHRFLGSTFLFQGKLEPAISHLRQAVKLSPEHPQLHRTLGSALASTGRPAEALEHLQAAVQLKSDWPEAINDIAWILATSPDPDLRDPQKAIRLTQRAAQLSNNQNALILDTLAAAYAAAGQFDRAVNTAKKAIALASAANAQEQVIGLSQRLSLYEQSQAYREPRAPLP